MAPVISVRRKKKWQQPLYHLEMIKQTMIHPLKEMKHKY